MKGSDNVFDSSIASKIPVVSHLTYNELHVLLLGVLIGLATRHAITLGYATVAVLTNLFLVGVLLGVGVASETRMTSLIRQESWYYLGGVVGGYAAYIWVIA